MAEKILRVITKTESKKHGTFYQRFNDQGGYGLKEPYELAAAFLKSPAWHDRPTGPGLWVVGGVVWDINERTISRTLPFGRVYGPIPADKETAT